MLFAQVGVAQGAEYEDAGATRGMDQVVQEAQGALAGPVQIVEQEGNRSRIGE